MKKIVIIGAGGFIGSHLNNLFSVNNKTIPIYKGDINLLDYREVRDFLLAKQPEVVINAYSAGGKSRSKDVDLDIVAENIIVFDNFRKNKRLFDKYINIGSGAEFNKEGLCYEEDILTSVPTTSYGLSKNLISRMCLQEHNFYTLRLFGCFGKGEPDFRLFSKYMSSEDDFIIDDKYFDNMSINDFMSVVGYFVKNEPLLKDINCVYHEKLLISEQLHVLSNITGHRRKLVITQGKDYIGSSFRLKSLDIPLSGITSGLELYK